MRLSIPAHVLRGGAGAARPGVETPPHTPLTGAVFQLQGSVRPPLGQFSQSQPSLSSLLLTYVSLSQMLLPRVIDEQDVTNQRPPTLGLCHTQ